MSTDAWLAITGVMAFGLGVTSGYMTGWLRWGTFEQQTRALARRVEQTQARLDYEQSLAAETVRDLLARLAACEQDEAAPDD